MIHDRCIHPLLSSCDLPTDRDVRPSSGSPTLSLCSCSLFTRDSSWALRRFRASMRASHWATRHASNSTPFSCRGRKRHTDAGKSHRWQGAGSILIADWEIHKHCQQNIQYAKPKRRHVVTDAGGHRHFNCSVNPEILRYMRNVASSIRRGGWMKPTWATSTMGGLINVCTISTVHFHTCQTSMPPPHASPSLLATSPLLTHLHCFPPACLRFSLERHLSVWR